MQLSKKTRKSSWNQGRKPFFSFSPTIEKIASTIAVISFRVIVPSLSRSYSRNAHSSFSSSLPRDVTESAWNFRNFAFSVRFFYLKKLFKLDRAVAVVVENVENESGMINDACKKKNLLWESSWIAFWEKLSVNFRKFAFWKLASWTIFHKTVVPMLDFFRRD